MHRLWWGILFCVAPFAAALAEKSADTADATTVVSTTESSSCAVTLASAPTRARFAADGGADRLPKNSTDREIVSSAAAWLRWHGFTYKEIAAMLLERGLVPTAGLTSLSDKRVRTLVDAYRPFAVAKANALDPRRKLTALEAGRILRAANFTAAAIATYLNDRRVPWPDPSKKKTNADESDDVEPAAEGAVVELWTAARVLAVIESPERPGAMYNPRFEDEADMANVIADAGRIGNEAKAQARKKMLKDPEGDPLLAMAPLSDDDQNTLFLAMNYLLHRSALERERAGPWATVETSEALRLALHCELVAKGLQDDLLLSNLRLVKSIAKSFMLQYDIDDLMQEGQFGLRRAIETYDVLRKVRPSTWMTNVVQRWFLRLVKADNTQSRSGARNNVSLDTLGAASSEDGTTAMPVEDQYTDNPLEGLVDAETHRRLRKAIDKLEPRDRLVLRLRFGFVDGEKWELQRIGDHIGLTRERVRQIETEALAKLATILATLRERPTRRRTARPSS